MLKKCLISLTLPFLIALLTPLIHCLVLDQNDLVTDTCRQTPNFQLCICTVRQDPRSQSVDIAGIGLILVEAIKAKTTTTIGQIRKLLVSQPHLKVADIPPPVEALTKGDPKFAETAVVDASNEAKYCEEGFIQSQSPLTAQNKAMNDLAVVATAVIRMLL
ncbi:hypothetical protein NMG60_11032989 [Bertholletia excelsa]